MACILSHIYTDHDFSTAFVYKYPQRSFAGCYSFLFRHFTILIHHVTSPRLSLCSLNRCILLMSLGNDVSFSDFILCYSHIRYNHWRRWVKKTRCFSLLSSQCPSESIILKIQNFKKPFAILFQWPKQTTDSFSFLSSAQFLISLYFKIILFWWICLASYLAR